jgi:protein-L-isoaspartate O-methyltransferase
MTHSIADDHNAVFLGWVSALEERHLANLRVPEITRALRALSSAYVERRHKMGSTLDTAGKRAAFALFYGPLHFIAVSHAVSALAAVSPPPSSILDIGCGTGVAGAAWALAAGRIPKVEGIDRHAWAVEEARRTYRDLGISGVAKRGDVTRVHRIAPSGAVIAAYVLNELPDVAREAVEDRLLDAAARGTRVLIVEPIARRVTPWWDATASRFAELGGRSDEWRVAVELPIVLRLLDKAAGLNHQEMTFRTLFAG